MEGDKEKTYELKDGNIAARRYPATATAERESARYDEENLHHTASDYDSVRMRSSGTTVVQGIGEYVTADLSTVLVQPQVVACATALDGR